MGNAASRLKEPLRYGRWSGRTDGMSGQDVVIAVKPLADNNLTNGVADGCEPRVR